MKEELKQCTKCKECKPATAFYKEPRTKNGLQAQCKTCQQTAYNNYRKKHPEVYRKASLKHWRSLNEEKKQERWIKRYKLSAEQYYEMFKKQKEVCKICEKKCSSRKNLSVDHCHQTGKVRGLLCVKCNTSLGMLNDDISLFYKAIEYLKGFEESP
jgi:glucan-binding YG repeat protein